VVSTTEPLTYRLEVNIYWPGNRYPGDSGVQWEKPFNTVEEAHSAVLQALGWFQNRGREVEAWLYQVETLVKYYPRR
jgi:hypothetical protein